ncbi:hypothetical protein [Runella limosa]|uniref:hypothetical protein n=1 Tax=Runella limosa TaxID=370978 RepID=UPI0004913D64|nr:hypothetical protein [Runella limosa]
MNLRFFLKEVFYNTLYFVLISLTTNLLGLQILVKGIGSIMFMQIYFALIVPLIIYHFFTVVSIFLLKNFSSKRGIFWINIFIFCILPIIYILANNNIYINNNLDDPILIDIDKRLEQNMAYTILLLTSIGLLITYLVRYNHWIKIIEKH